MDPAVSLVGVVSLTLTVWETLLVVDAFSSVTTLVAVVLAVSSVVVPGDKETVGREVASLSFPVCPDPDESSPVWVTLSLGVLLFFPPAGSPGVSCCVTEVVLD